MNVHDKITTTISLFALMISMLVGYVQLFHESNELDGFFRLYERGEGYVIYDVTFINSGTTPLGVISVWGTNALVPDFSDALGYVDVIEPLVIAPKTVVHRRVKHKFHKELKGEIYAGLDFKIADFDGSIFSRRIHLVTIDSKDWMNKFQVHAGLVDLLIDSKKDIVIPNEQN